jgi:hypothetical protein
MRYIGYIDPRVDKSTVFRDDVPGDSVDLSVVEKNVGDGGIKDWKAWFKDRVDKATFRDRTSQTSLERDWVKKNPQDALIIGDSIPKNRGQGMQTGINEGKEAADSSARDWLLLAGLTIVSGVVGMAGAASSARAARVYPRDYATKSTENVSAAFKSEGEARNFARAKLGGKVVEIEPGKLRSVDGKWQFRAKAGDIADLHAHLEQLDPETGEVKTNWHLRWEEGTGR